MAGGHESHAGRDLAPYLAAGLARRAVAPGRELRTAVDEALAASELPVCVVAMTFGRDPRLVADTARALDWANRSRPPGRLALAEPFGTQEHLIGWLRAAAGRHSAADLSRTALLVTAPAAAPGEDADLFRVARLVAQYARYRWVEVAIDGGEPGIAEVTERCRGLGADDIVVLPASFAPIPRVGPNARDGGGLLSTGAVAEILTVRADAALRRLATGDDGIGPRLAAGHDHSHDHSHSHSHNHNHDHGHDHDPYAERPSTTAERSGIRA